MRNSYTWGKENPDRAAWITLVFFVLAGVLILGRATWNAPFVMDEWQMIYRAQDPSLTEIFAPWNNHLVAVGLLFARLSISLFGLDFTPLILLNLAGIAALSVLIYAYSKQRLGPWIAIFPALVPLFLSASSDTHGTGMQLSALLGIESVFSLIFGIAALMFVDRQTRSGDVLACVMLTLCLATFSYGLAFIVGLAVAILLSGHGWRRIWIVAIPALLYLAWKAWAAHRYGSQEIGILAENVLWLPLYFADSIGAVVAALFGVSHGLDQGPATMIAVSQDATKVHLLLAVAVIITEIAAIVWLARKLGREGFTRASLWPPLAVLFALWTSQGLIMDPIARMPAHPRYLLAGGVLLAIVLAEIARRFRFTTNAMIIMVVLAGIGIAGNVYGFEQARTILLKESERAGTVTAMMELAGEQGDPDFNPGADLHEYAPTMWLPASSYLELKSRQGSLAAPIEAVVTGDPANREAADQLLARLYRLEAHPTTGDEPDLRCRRIAAGEEVAVRPGLTILRGAGPSSPALRRFADLPTIQLGPVGPGAPLEVTIPADDGPLPWKLSDPSGAAMTVCRPD